MKKLISLVLCIVFVLCLAACETMDTSSSVLSSKETAKPSAPKVEKPIKIPEIMSEDSVMPTYLDISLYDEENYADIYLGKNFEYSITYSGSEITVPTTYNKMIKNGWSLIDSAEYNEDSQIMTGKSITVDFVNQYHKKITAVFHNDKKSSTSLKKCDIVKFIVKENVINNTKSEYGQFWVNGISNESAITDMIEFLGSPSHFYKVENNKYYLDWFITEDDKRSGITVYVDTAEDSIDAIEFAYY